MNVNDHNEGYLGWLDKSQSFWNDLGTPRIKSKVLSTHRGNIESLGSILERLGLIP